MTRAIGIDLGTYFSEVTYLGNGRPKVIPNAEGQHCTPSVVAFTQGEELLVGQAAKRQAATNPQKTVTSIKRRMGSRYKVSIDGRKYTPQEVSSFILRKLRDDAANCLGDEGIYFNDRQRQATKGGDPRWSGCPGTPE